VTAEPRWMPSSRIVAITRPATAPVLTVREAEPLRRTLVYITGRLQMTN
jgi:hypothetical protein